MRGGDFVSPAPAGIDPSSTAPRLLIRGLPRPRGDRPPDDVTLKQATESPPPPRGSTPPNDDPRNPSPVSPAPAGIDPINALASGSIWSLPRPRGDRPSPSSAIDLTSRSPPPPRGSTLDHVAGTRGHGVSPAPAGIDPRCRSCNRPGRRLPRRRGDRPFIEGLFFSPSQSPPPPRGSTLRDHDRWVHLQVSPAPAGIDPGTDRTRNGGNRLPRPRGDRPKPAMPARTRMKSPPPPRGSTRALLRGAVIRGVSPAPAGIDPRGWSATRSTRSLPRPRGDRPSITSPVRGATASPPPPRGSTLVHLLVQLVPRVSPAPAGIDPRWMSHPISAARLPRPRGDRPGRYVAKEHLPWSPPPPRGSTRAARLDEVPADVSPAPAGIDPARASIATGPACLPRPRGDRPPTTQRASRLAESTPPPRGSTLASHWSTSAREVSPAPAGIDPCPRRGWSGARRLPRPRGDRPPEP